MPDDVALGVGELFGQAHLVGVEVIDLAQRGAGAVAWAAVLCWGAETPDTPGLRAAQYWASRMPLGAEAVGALRGFWPLAPAE